MMKYLFFLVLFTGCFDEEVIVKPASDPIRIGVKHEMSRYYSHYQKSTLYQLRSELVFEDTSNIVFTSGVIKTSQWKYVPTNIMDQKKYHESYLSSQKKRIWIEKPETVWFDSEGYTRKLHNEEQGK